MLNSPPTEARQKKTRKDAPAGSQTMSGPYYSVSRYLAVRTHEPLARHVFCSFFHIEYVDKLALHAGAKKSNGRSKSDLAG
jgi:hypothetical protein